MLNLVRAVPLLDLGGAAERDGYQSTPCLTVNERAYFTQASFKTENYHLCGQLFGLLAEPLMRRPP